MRVFSRHRCNERHEHFYEFVRCIRPKAVVIGDGRYAVMTPARIWLFADRAEALAHAEEERTDNAAADIEVVELSRVEKKRNNPTPWMRRSGQSSWKKR